MAIGYKALIEAAEKEIETVTVADAQSLLDDEDTIFVDLRDIRELWREGKLPGAYHAPRGMLEFWIDPESPYHRDIFAEDKKFIFYCASAWRSALAAQTAQMMGMQRVSHMGGGFSAWKEAGAPIEAVEKK